MEEKKERRDCMVIVDDEVQILKSLKLEIEIAPFDNPFEIVTFDNTADTITFIEENHERIFLLIADLRMPVPNMSGSDLLLYIHKHFPDILLVLLTAYSDLPEIQKAITADIQALIFKPWTPSMVVAEIIKARRVHRLVQAEEVYKNHIRQQLELAGDFQRDMLRPLQDFNGDVKIDYRYEPLSDYKCGGDYYDIIRLSDERTLILLGDVSGHGIKPALVTGMLKITTLSVLRELQSFRVSDFLTEVNRRISSSLSFTLDLFICLTAVIVDTNKWYCEVANAGHCHPVLVRGGVCSYLKSNQPAMVFKNDFQFSYREYSIEKGDRIALFSDGLVELCKESGVIPSGVMECSFVKLADSEHPADFLFETMKNHHSEGKYKDDVTVIVISL